MILCTLSGEGTNLFAISSPKYKNKKIELLCRLQLVAIQEIKNS